MFRPTDFPDPPDIDAEIAAYVATLRDFHASLDEKQISTTNIDLALHQIEFLRGKVWGGMDPIVRFYVPRYLPHGSQMDPEHMKECLKKACDEHVVKLHRLIMRRFIEGKTVSLAALVDEMFSPDDKDDWGDFRRRVKENILYRMRDIGIWSYTGGETLKSKAGNDYVTEFKVTAGPALLAFHKHIFRYWNLRYARFTCKLLGNMED